MGGVTLKIHPLFYLFGLYYALTGRIFIFIVCIRSLPWFTNWGIRLLRRDWGTA